jgi:YidC/Oxa1 family membrane protein insertase
MEGPVVYLDGALETVAAADAAEPVTRKGLVGWAGYADHYFLSAYYPDTTAPLRFSAASAGGYAESTLWSDGPTQQVAYGLYVGPKKLAELRRAGHQLEGAVDLGWFAFVARPLLELMLLLNKLTGNYGWSIILLTVGVRLVFYPINKRQALAMKAMQKIQPELKKIQEKFKDDREKLNREVMEVYRRHKVNPLAGCLPMLLQLPVFLGLYNALMQSIELRHAPFLGWITDLSQPDRLGTLAIPFVNPPGVPVLTILMGASMVIQQRMMPAAGDPAQQRMLMLMPVVFTVMFINFPSGLVLYWFASNVMSIGQQYLTNRLNG